AGDRSERRRPVRRRRNALPRRESRPTPRTGAGLPADGARLRTVSQAGRARRGRRRRTCTCDVRAGNLDHRPAAGPAAGRGGAGRHRGDALLSDQSVEPLSDTPEVPPVPPVPPVLPLKETVVFPESMSPLAIGQERSIKLIDDVVA